MCTLSRPDVHAVRSLRDLAYAPGRGPRFNWRKSAAGLRLSPGPAPSRQTRGARARQLLGTTPRHAKKAGRKNRGKKERAYGTPDSHVVPHRSTDEACSGLTAQFGRDTVCYTEYGRRHLRCESEGNFYSLEYRYRFALPVPCSSTQVLSYQ